MAASMEVVKSELQEGLYRSSNVWLKIITLVDDCTLPPLIKPRDEYVETNFVDEFDRFFEIVPDRLAKLMEAIRLLKGRIVLKSLSPEFMAALVLLLHELKTGTPWARNNGYSEHYNEINRLFKNAFDFDLREKFPDKPPFENLGMEIFVVSMEKLHQKLTKELWKRQPGALHCYRLMLNKWTKTHKIKCPYPLIFPAIFLQIDDYEERNKIEGLKCCCSVLKNVDRTGCQQNGYETVIYESLEIYIRFPRLEIVNATLQCLILLLPIIGGTKSDNQWNRIDEVYESLLDGLAIASANDKKKTYVKYLTHLINMNSSSAIRWKKKILLLINDGLEIYLSDSVFKYTDMVDYLNCLEIWLKVGWPVWSYHMDKQLIILMYKVIHHHKKCSETYAEVRCLLIMLSLCNEQQRKSLLSEEYVKLSSFPKQFQNVWNTVLAKF